MSVTVVSCVYGNYGRFVPGWVKAIRALDPQPQEIIIATDITLGDRDNIWVVSSACDWQHPQAYHLNQAISCATTDWVWVADIDDKALPDALAGIDAVAADVWQMGFLRTDGVEYVPPQLTAAEYLAADRNEFVGSSAFRVSAFRAVGGYRDVALQDWALWRALAANGATFESSGRAHFRYNRHPDTRGETELDAAHRPAHLAEMAVAENDVLAAHLADSLGAHAAC